MMEVIVTLSIFSLLVPGVLMTSFYFSSMAEAGANRNDALVEARRLQQFFVQKINASRTPEVADDGNKLILTLYNEAEDAWEEASFCFLESSSSLVYCPPTTSGPAPLSNAVYLARPAHRNGTRDIFETVSLGNGGGIRCDLYIGKQAPENSDKVGGVYITPGIFVDLVASSRN